MNKDSRYGLIALTSLFVASAAAGGFIYMSNNRISASTDQTVQTISNAIPLQAGWNYFTNGVWTITSESEIIGINGSLIPVSKAQERGIIGRITSEDGKMVLGVNTSNILANSKFIIEAKDISTSPKVYIQQNGE